MNLLIMNGSPRGEASNSLQLARAFAAGISQAVQPQRRELQLNQLNVQPCRGCFACWRSTPGQCCLRDDMGQIIEALLWADVTLWSFPLYYYSVPGSLKTVIDRMLPMVLPFMDRNATHGGHPSRYDMSGKRNVLISTCGFYTAQGNYDGVTAIFDRMWGKGQYDTVFCGQGELFRAPQAQPLTQAYLQAVRQAGCEFADGGIAPQTRSRLAELLLPRDVFERMADGAWGQ